ncbi:hypothetical protein M409DRAFT_21619 [Zasmidium cellare ATCC 36951]|uniref:Uncharacterized protein n=1 Tax=Zasmidium cellare ATCC 36951 TaxID=1080233 RepID=A0A6A6CM01_ZASCE|nr:uncharacterized protein M409DRAFT_21619 [Zasmidium cellare ATCC 36951]KAF2168175.1 hypothetical protein M409DRAFT_21619 [Zasmidium cellare ATCC 36951]
MSQEIILYDLPSQAPCRSWSGNVWKTRLALNFKGVPYKTEWIPYIRLQETIKSFGVEPHPPGSWSEFSVPTVRFPDGTYVMDSAAIAKELEYRYPSPSFRLNPKLEEEAHGAMGKVFMALAVPLMPYATEVVSLEDLEWFKTDRARRFGMTVEVAFDKSKDPVPHFVAAKPAFEECSRVLKAHKVDEGPFLLGSQPCYADFYFMTTLQMFHQSSKEGFALIMEYVPSELKNLFEACQKWTIKQD